ncbi:MAG: MmoB/DmpM family protein [Canidatus Methanoxibalbensis ujae]|nr:MmoB/DmpM family protein [Candidatus Methanoxibalbensis ujae]MCW7078703.1 MmoB/DmpM family protein [Candidatus Methanoxibalbensis ujae]
MIVEVMKMVSVFIEAIPLNMAIARAICNDNRSNNAYFERYSGIIRIRGDGKLILKRRVIEGAIGRALTENEWDSVTFNYIGVISKYDDDEIVFEDTEESKERDQYWDMLVERVMREVGRR